MNGIVTKNGNIKMAIVETKSHESQSHLEAMLYLLEDPVLDREAFETRLANDPQLGEILAKSVTVFESLESIKFDSQTMVHVAHGSGNSYRWWISFATIAASLLLLGFLGWQSLYSIRSGPIEIATSSTENVSLNRVVWAWGELKADDPEAQLLRDAADGEFENTLAMLDPFIERDVPDWLVLATTDILEDGINQKDVKALIQ